MSNLLKAALSNVSPLGAIGGIVDSAAGLARVFVTDKSAKETNIHDEQIAAYQGEANEALAQQRDNRTWWDSFVDGLNRLPRPLMAFMAIGVLVWCPISPVGFSAAMVAYQLVPSWLAMIVAQIFVLFAGGRMLSDHFEMKANDPKNVAAVLGQIKEIKAMQQGPAKAIEEVEPDPYKLANKISDKDFKEQMADNSKPLSLDAIVEWNKRKGNG